MQGKTKTLPMLQNLNTEAAATFAAFSYLINSLLAKIGAPHVTLDVVNHSAQTIFLLTGGLLSTGWLYYRLRNEQLKFRSGQRRYDEQRSGRDNQDDEKDI